MNKLKTTHSQSRLSEPAGLKGSVDLWFKITLLLGCLFLCIPTAASQPITPYKAQVNDTCDLQCWLNSLVIHIPDQSFEAAGFNVTLSNIYCMNITLDGMDSYLVPPVGIDFYAYGLGLNCTMDWSYYEVVIPSIKGHGTATAVVSDSSLNVTMQLLVGSDGLAYAANLTSCDAHIHVDSVTITGSILADLLSIIINAISSLLESELETVICDELTTLVNTNLTAVLVQIDQAIKPYLVTPTPAPAPPVPATGMTDLMTSPMITFIDDLVNNFFGPQGINNVVNFLTNSTGAFSLDNLEKFNYTLNVTGVGNVTFGLISVNVSDLNSWDMIEAMVPISKYSLWTRTGMSQLKFAIEFFVNVSLDNSPVSLYETGVFSADLKDNVLNASAQAAFYSHPYDDLTLDQLSSIGCLLDGIYDLNLTMLSFNFTIGQISVNATSGGTEEELDNIINNVLALFVGAFMPVIPALFNGIVAGPVRNLVNEGFAALLASDEPCPPAGYVPADTNWESTSIATIGAVTTFFAITLGVILLTRYKKDNRKLKGVPSEDQLVEAVPLLNDYVSPILVRNEYTLMMDPAIHWVVRYLVPFALLTNIVLFISSNTSNGASVYIVLEDQDGTVKLPSLFDFSLGNSVQDMWDAGVYPLSILIAVFSGAWPYMKLVMMLFCWLIPVKYLTVKRREYLLMVLDALGKWSLIDSFVLTLMMVAFHFDLAPADGSSQAAIEAYVEPKWGFYCFLLATMMSLTMSHIILALHNYAKGAPEINDPERLPLYAYAFRSKNKLARKGLTFLMVFLVVFALILVSVGSAIISFEFQFKGALELILEYLGQPTNQPYSVITLGVGLPGSSETPNSFGVRWIQATFFIFALVVPLLYLTTLLFLWLTPMTFKMQKRVFVCTEVLNAWAALEVFVVSIIAALLEIQQFAAFIIGDKCDGIDKILEKYFVDQLDGDVTCFDVIATLESGCWLLFGACIIYVAVGSLVIRTTHKILTEREETFIEEILVRKASSNFPSINK